MAYTLTFWEQVHLSKQAQQQSFLCEQQERRRAHQTAHRTNRSGKVFEHYHQFSELPSNSFQSNNQRDMKMEWRTSQPFKHGITVFLLENKENRLPSSRCLFSAFEMEHQVILSLIWTQTNQPELGNRKLVQFQSACKIHTRIDIWSKSSRNRDRGRHTPKFHKKSKRSMNFLSPHATQCKYCMTIEQPGLLELEPQSKQSNFAQRASSTLSMHGFRRSWCDGEGTKAGSTSRLFFKIMQFSGNF